jgi:hypothetical protein
MLVIRNHTIKTENTIKAAIGAKAVVQIDIIRILAKSIPITPHHRLLKNRTTIDETSTIKMNPVEVSQAVAVVPKSSEFED